MNSGSEYRFFLPLLLFLWSLLIQQSYTTKNATNTDNEEQVCNLSKGRTGLCKNIGNCPAALSDLRSGVKNSIVMCPDGDRRVVCCQVTPRISAMMCTKYMNMLKNSGGPYPLLPPAFMEESDRSNEVYCNPKLNPLISGGRTAELAEFPHVVAIGYNVSTVPWRCGGTLISDQFVLTAAHCVLGKPTKILLGDITLNKASSVSRIISDISEIFTHPEYNPPQTYHDLALIKLASKIELSRFIFPACLSQPEDDLLKGISSKNFSAAGWGVLGTGEEQSNNLQVVNLEGFNYKTCDALYSRAPAKELKFPYGILKSQICAGDKIGRRDTCKGDSGGPLWLNIKKRCVFHLVGITSFGPNQCGEKSPGVYTNTLSYLEWIEDIVWSK